MKAWELMQAIENGLTIECIEDIRCAIGFRHIPAGTIIFLRDGRLLWRGPEVDEDGYAHLPIHCLVEFADCWAIRGAEGERP